MWTGRHWHSLPRSGIRLLVPIKLSGTIAYPKAVFFSMPFSEEIMNAPRSCKVKMPNLELYNGTTDLEEHFGVYKAHMYVQDVDDVANCKYFPITLKGVA